MSNNLATIDIGIIAFYFLTVLTVGLLYSKCKDIKEYAIGGRVFCLPMLIATLLATNIGGDAVMGSATQIYKDGGMIIIIALGRAMSCVLFLQHFAPSFYDKFNGMISAGDIIGKHYGVAAERFTAVIGVVRGLGILGIQMIGMGSVTSYLLSISYTEGLLLAGCVTVFYSVLGGIKAVAVTDLIQFILLIVALPVIAVFVIHGPGMEAVTKNIPSIMSTISHPSAPIYAEKFLFLLTTLYLFDPCTIQRYLMVSNKQQINKLLIHRIWIEFLIFVLVFIISCGVIAQCTIQNPNDMITQSIREFLPPVAQGLAIVGLFSILMSSIDSELNTTGIMLVHNLIRTFYKNKVIPHEIAIVRIMTCFIGMLAIYWATCCTDTFMYGAALSSVWIIISIPIMFATSGMLVPPQVFWVSIVSTSVVGVISHFFYAKHIFFTMLASALAGVMITVVAIAILNSDEVNKEKTT